MYVCMYVCTVLILMILQGSVH